ncbi:tetratricopeptide repeat protein [Micromonosporaceae bacterium Da 78-11]
MEKARKRSFWNAIQKNPRQVVGALDGEVRRTPRDADAAFLYGVALFRLGDFGPAERWFQAARRLRPTDPTATYYAGLCAERLGRGREAIEAYRQALSLDPTMRVAREKLRSAGIPGPAAAARVSRHPREQPVAGPAPRPPRPAPQASARPKTAFWLPDNAADFREFERLYPQRALIEARAEKAVWWPSLPVWTKLIIIGFCLLLVVAFVPRLVHEAGPDGSSAKYQQGCELVRQQARKQGVELPPC